MRCPNCCKKVKNLKLKYEIEAVLVSNQIYIEPKSLNNLPKPTIIEWNCTKCNRKWAPKN